MSYRNYIEAMNMARDCKYYMSEGGKSKADIRKSEEKLGITFSKQCTCFYMDYGYISFDGNEIFGIDPYDSDILEGNSVAYAINERDKYGLPLDWIPIYNYNDGNMAFLDYSTTNDDDEPRVIMAYCDGTQYVLVDVVAEDLGDFLLGLVRSNS